MGTLEEWLILFLLDSIKSVTITCKVVTFSFFSLKLLTMFYEGSGGAWTDYISELTTVGAKKFPSVPPEAVHNLLQK